MASVFRNGQRSGVLAQNAEPNIVPFIDVLLVLLVIFMVTAPKPTTDLRVDLPRQAAGAPERLAPTIVRIESSATGVRVFVGDEETPLGGLAAAALDNILSVNPAYTRDEAKMEARIFVRADLNVAYHNVVDALEELKSAEFERVSIVAPEIETAL
ncbi:MAG: biopolymer transporter ExbD [Hyphomonadaceae bacterium]|nr:biopolymer transporter ExbD [Hyphomonadaceae bacterium]